MKLAFSTLGCPLWSFDDVVTAAKDLGLDGIELRGLGTRMFAPDIPELQPPERTRALARLRDTGLGLPILSSGAQLAHPDRETAQAAFVEACAYVNLASALGVPYVRVMGTGAPQPTEGNFELGALLFGGMSRYAMLFGVTPLIETNGALSSSDEMLRFLEHARSDNCGVLWDVHHTVRFGGEAPAQTAKRLGLKIRHVHVKDSEVIGGAVHYRMPGAGTLPVGEAVAALGAAGYEGYYSLEWVKRWQPDLQEPGIVFAQYKNFMENL
jgi:fatty-acyl-CoA synthase